MLLEKLAILAQLFSLLDFFWFSLVLNFGVCLCSSRYRRTTPFMMIIMVTMMMYCECCDSKKSIYMINTNLVCILFTLSLLMFIVTHRNSSRHRRPSELVFVSHILLLLITVRMSPNW